MVYNFDIIFRCFLSMSFGYWFVKLVVYYVGSSDYEQVLTVWGLIGVHTDKFGFKHVWEIW